MTPSERTGLAWLWIIGSGETNTKQLATSLGRSIRLVQLYTQQARAWLKRNRTEITLVMRGVVGACIHGLPIMRVEGEKVWVCLDCDVTNDPEHPDFRRGQIHRKNRDDKPAETDTKEPKPTIDQPKGKPAFKPRIRKPKENRPQWLILAVFVGGIMAIAGVFAMIAEISR